MPELQTKFRGVVKLIAAVLGNASRCSLGLSLRSARLRSMHRESSHVPQSMHSVDMDASG
eukprot:6203653-Pleurochrysis_carterae.AAC.2